MSVELSPIGAEHIGSYYIGSNACLKLFFFNLTAVLGDLFVLLSTLDTILLTG